MLTLAQKNKLCEDFHVFIACFHANFAMIFHSVAISFRMRFYMIMPESVLVMSVLGSHTLWTAEWYSHAVADGPTPDCIVHGCEITCHYYFESGHAVH